MLVSGEHSMWFFKYSGFLYFMDPLLVICICPVDQRGRSVQDQVGYFLCTRPSSGRHPSNHTLLDFSILPNPRNLHQAESSENGLIPNLSGQTVETWKIDSLIQLPVLEIKSRLLILSLVFLLCQVESLFVLLLLLFIFKSK